MAVLPAGQPDWQAWEAEIMHHKGWTFADTLRHYLKSLWKDKVAFLCGLIFLTVLLSAIFAPFLTPYLPGKGNLLDALVPIGGPDHILGTDALGRDNFARLIYGARASLRVGLIVTVTTGIIGTLLGLVAGYYGKWVDSLLMRLVDIQLAFPGMLVALAFVLVLGVGERNVIIALAFNGWMTFTRQIRSQVMTMRDGPLVEAAHAVGMRPRRIILRYLLPSVMSPVINLFVLELARIILAESVLSFLGYGIQPPNSSWGLMIADAKNYMTTSPSLIVIPGLAIGVTVLTLNILASWYLSVSDPVLRKTFDAKRAQKEVRA